MDSEILWTIFGLAAQGLFFGRFFVSWVASERAHKTTIPVYFWYFSITGALLTLIYSIHRQDIVFVTSQSLAMGIYIRSLIIHNKHTKTDEI